MRHPRILVAGALAVSLALSGCASGSDLPQDLATSMQSQVMSVSTAAASLDYATALTRLAELEVALNDAVARGTLTADRAEAIRSALELVRADLTALSLPPETPAEENTGNDKEGNGNGKGKPDQNDD